MQTHDRSSRTLPARRFLRGFAASCAAALVALGASCASTSSTTPEWGKSQALVPIDFLINDAVQFRELKSPHERYVLVRITNKEHSGPELIGLRGVLRMRNHGEERICDVKLESAAGDAIPLAMNAEIDGNRFAVRGFPPLKADESFLLWLDLCTAPKGGYAIEFAAEY